MLGQVDFSTIYPAALLWDNPQMAGTSDLLRERLRERLDAAGKSPHAVSRAIGANPGYVRDLLDPDKTSTPSAVKLQALAGELETTTDYLLGKAEGPTQPLSEVGFRDVPAAWRGHGEGRGERIPVFGTGYCDDLEIPDDGQVIRVEQTLFEPEHVVQMIERPAALWAAKDAYAIYFHGSSMEPRFDQGGIGIVNPARPPAPGDCVVVQLNDGSTADVVHVLVKRLVRQTASYVDLEQFNPPLTFRIDRKRVARMHLILTPAHLYL